MRAVHTRNITCFFVESYLVTSGSYTLTKKFDSKGSAGSRSQKGEKLSFPSYGRFAKTLTAAGASITVLLTCRTISKHSSKLESCLSHALQVRFYKEVDIVRKGLLTRDMDRNIHGPFRSRCVQ